MDQAIKDRMDGLVSARALFDFHGAAKALFRDLRHSGDGHSKNDIHDFMRSVLDVAMTEAEVEGH